MLGSYPFNKYLFNAYYASCFVQRAGKVTVNKLTNNSHFQGAHILVGRRRYIVKIYNVLDGDVLARILIQYNFYHLGAL